jgi:ketosteroid isomerase-like protein
MTFTLPIDRLAAHGRALLVGLTFTVLATTGAAWANTPAQVAEVEARNEATVREAFGRWVGGGNVFKDLLAPDVVWTIHGSGPIAGTYRGIEDVVNRAAGPLVSRLATPIIPDVHHIWAAGDRVIIRFDASATTTSGGTYQNQFVWILRMDGGSVVGAEAFLDLVEYQRVVDNNPPRQR